MVKQDQENVVEIPSPRDRAALHGGEMGSL